MMLFLFFLGIIFFIIISVLFSTLKIRIKDFKTNNEKDYKVKLNIILNLYLFNCIKIFGFKLDEKMINNIKNNTIFKKINFITFKKNSVIEYLKNITNYSYIKLEEFKLKLYVSTESMLITVFLVPTISSLLSLILAKNYNKNNNYEYQIIPLYEEENKFNLELKSIISVKMIHIIYIIYIFLKRSENKNERTSNRGNYEYCNGQYKKYDRCKYHYRRAN